MIVKFLQKVEKEEGQTIKASQGLKKLSPGVKRPSQPTSKGARTKPGLAAGRTSRPAIGPSVKEGGTMGKGSRKEGKRASGPLEKWLLPLGKAVRPSSTYGQGREDQE